MEVRAIQDYKVIEWNTCWKYRLSEGTDDIWKGRLLSWAVVSVCMFIDWSLASLEWTLVLYLYIIPGPQLPGPGFFYWIPAVSSCFQLFPAVSRGLHLLRISRELLCDVPRTSSYKRITEGEQQTYVSTDSKPGYTEYCLELWVILYVHI